MTWATTRLPAGRYEVVASGGLPEGANETAPGNENATLAIEVFLGKQQKLFFRQTNEVFEEFLFPFKRLQNVYRVHRFSPGLTLSV